MSKQHWSVIIGTGVILIVLAVIAFFSSPAFRYTALIQIPGGSVVSFLVGSSPLVERYELAYYYFDQTENRNLDKAEKLLLLNSDDEPSLYLLARTYFARDDTARAIAVADNYLTLYPDNKRMHYVRGLAHAHQNKFEKAELDFKQFITAFPNEWAGYLDLSWVYFQTGRMSEARATIEQGYVVDEDNPWISSAYGVILYNRNEPQQAEYMLNRALTQAQELDLEVWRTAYSASDPKVLEKELAQFIDMIKFNLQLVQNKEGVTLDQVQSVYNIRFASQSLRGLEFGLHPSACNSTCPACNDCNDCQGFGTSPGERYEYHSDTSCAAPPMPSDYGFQCVSAANVCQQNTIGTIGCDGCTASTPENPIPSNDGYYYVPHGESMYLYEASRLAGSTPAQTCYSLVNNSGFGIFVPVKTIAEFNAFVASDAVPTDFYVDTLGN